MRAEASSSLHKLSGASSLVLHSVSLFVVLAVCLGSPPGVRPFLPCIHDGASRCEKGGVEKGSGRGFHNHSLRREDEVMKAGWGGQAVVRNRFVVSKPSSVARLSIYFRKYVLWFWCWLIGDASVSGVVTEA